MTLGMTTREVQTTGLRPDMVVRHHGMRLRVDEVVTCPRSGGRDVVIADCTVINLAEVLAEGFVPPAFLHDNKRRNTGKGREDFWTIQGNDRAWWTVEVTAD